MENGINLHLSEWRNNYYAAFTYVTKFHTHFETSEGHPVLKKKQLLLVLQLLNDHWLKNMTTVLVHQINKGKSTNTRNILMKYW